MAYGSATNGGLTKKSRTRVGEQFQATVPTLTTVDRSELGTAYSSEALDQKLVFRVKKDRDLTSSYTLFRSLFHANRKNLPNIAPLDMGGKHNYYYNADRLERIFPLREFFINLYHNTKSDAEMLQVLHGFLQITFKQAAECVPPCIRWAYKFSDQEMHRVNLLHVVHGKRLFTRSYRVRQPSSESQRQISDMYYCFRFYRPQYKAPEAVRRGSQYQSRKKKLKLEAERRLDQFRCLTAEVNQKVALKRLESQIKRMTPRGGRTTKVLET
ncbi:hypothetical protein J8273_4110 [Carpediemonas membranifera]|uniref:Uncharacterized protein n=1 Tax=Carpediemonas membranifera TaxID=201153 RepID=A0A8J6AWT1_9EUKA|nr:hypothetical protein J8273_4110 [Carpediemonas membranifera]|eukprot:KAG9394445.1 hypothetical protein J8273_4110 [Carpediemonas membranifera]